MTRTENRVRRGGFTLVELSVLVVLIFILALLGWKAMNRPRHLNYRILKCVNNLKNVGLALRIFATDNGDRYPMSLSTNQGGSFEFVNTTEVFRHFQALSNELSTPKILNCQTDMRTQAVNFGTLQNENLSYFLNLNAVGNVPTSLLAGDRNLMTNRVPVRNGIVELTPNVSVDWTQEMHNRQGNIAMGDGSVQQFNFARMRHFLTTSGSATNRLIVP